MITFRCSGCENEIETPDDYAGRSARCPTCGRRIRVPRKTGLQADSPALGLGESPSASSAVFRVDGRTYEVRPKLEGLLVAASAVIGLSLVAFVAVGLTAQVYSPWFLAGLVATCFALFGALLCLPAYQAIRTSGGRKTGQRLAFLNVAVAAVLVLAFLFVAIVWKYMLADSSSCRQRLQAVHVALRQYAAGNGGLLPSDLQTLVRLGLLKGSKLTCRQVGGVREGTPTYLRHSYPVVQGRALVDFRTDLEPFPGDLMILMDGGLHDVLDQATGQRVPARYVLALDGAVGYVPDTQLAMTLAFEDQARIISRVLEARNPRTETPVPEESPPSSDKKPGDADGAEAGRTDAKPAAQ